MPFAADRLRVLAGELCDWGDSYHASRAAPLGGDRPPQNQPEREAREEESKPADRDRAGDSNQASSGIVENRETETKEDSKTHQDREGRAPRLKEGKGTIPVKREPSEDSAFNTEERS